MAVSPYSNGLERSSTEVRYISSKGRIFVSVNKSTSCHYTLYAALITLTVQEPAKVWIYLRLRLTLLLDIGKRASEQY